MQRTIVGRAPLARRRAGARPFWRRHRVARTIEAYLLIAPWLIGFFVFVAGPMIASAVLALTSYDMLSPPRWVGLANFERMLGDYRLLIALSNTAYYTFLGVPLQLLIAFLLALALRRAIPLVGLFRTACYLPAVMPAVANVVLWVWILNPDYGLANAALRAVGLPPVSWLVNQDTSKPSLIAMSLWYTGPQMLVFLAGLQSVPAHLYDAAAVDGANRWASLRHITLPMISPITFYNLTMALIGSFQVFTSAFIATGGGPGDSTLFFVLYLYRNAFEGFRLGYASALAWVLFLLVVATTYVQFKLSGRWVYREAD